MTKLAWLTRLGARARTRLTLPLAAVLLLSTLGAGCATVRPEQRAVLADPIMQFDERQADDEARQHVLENREGSSGGGSVKGGGCGCN